MIGSFRPQIHDESETDQILNAKYFVWKNYTLGKWGLREAFNQNSLMQLFNGDGHIVHWSFVALSSTRCVARASLMLSWFVDLFVNRPRHSKSKSHKYSSCFSHWLRVAKRGRWYKIAQICRTECPQCARRRQALQNQNPFLSQCVFLFSC